MWYATKCCVSIVHCYRQYETFSVQKLLLSAVNCPDLDSPPIADLLHVASYSVVVCSAARTGTRITQFFVLLVPALLP